MRSPFSNRSLIEWLEHRQVGTTYLYVDQHDCGLCQYFKSMGLPVKYVGMDVWKDTDGNCHPLPDGWNRIIMGPATASTKWQSFSDAAKRARQELPIDG